MPTRRQHFDFDFETTVVEHSLGTYRYTVVFLAEELHDRLPLASEPRLRMRGEIDGVPIHGAWQPSKGRWYLMLSKDLLRQAGIRLGDQVRVRFRREDPDVVDVPAVLQEVFEEDRDLGQRWEQLGTGVRRALAIYVGSAKTPPTQQKRLAQMVSMLRTEASIPSAGRELSAMLKRHEPLTKPKGR